MEIILTAVLLLAYVLCAYTFYNSGKENGYEKREKEFQEKPVNFTIDQKSVVWIGRESGIVKIRIYDKKLVEIISDPVGKEE